MARSFGNTRPVDVVFQVRDVRRDPNNPAAVLGTGQYNVPGDPGLVRNTVNATGFPVTGTPISSTSVDEVVIVDVPLTTQTDKAWKGGPVAIPDGGPATAYPLTRIRVTTRNTTPAKVDRLQIIDPAPGSTADPFNAFSFNRFVAITAPTGTQTSLVTLTYVGGATQSFSIAQALALTPADLAGDVSGVQVASDGRIAAAAAGVLEFEVRLRATHRDGSGPVTIANSPVPNEARGTISDLGGLGGHTATDLGNAAMVLEDATISVNAGKTLSPATQKEPDNGVVTATLSGQPGGSARTVSMTITDDDASFWNAFDYVGLAPSFTLAAPITRVTIEHLTGGVFSAGPANTIVVTGGTWVSSPNGMNLAQAKAYAATLPADLHGLRFTFASENGLGWTFPANPLQTIPVQLQRRDTLRTGGPVPSTRSDQVAAPGETEAGVFWNTISADVVSSPTSPGNFLTASADAQAQYRYLHRETSVSVLKTPRGNVQPGTVIPFTLSFSNFGETAVTNPVFTDRLPMDASGPQLIFDPDRDPSTYPYSFSLSGAAPTPPSGAALPTAPAAVTTTIAPDGSSIQFTVPAGTVLEVGQSYTITINLMLRPGLRVGDVLTNVAVIRADQPFDGCNTTLSTDRLECSDDTVVTPLSVPALSTRKLVRADQSHNVAGLPNVISTANNFDCSTAADADGFFRSPCVPVTVPGADEVWRFAVTNSGTLPIDTVVAMDQLPAPGDTGLIITNPRGSAWPTEFSGDVQLVPSADAPPGAAMVTLYSTSASPCATNLNPLGTQCVPGAWSPLTPGVDLKTVKSLMFVVTFPPNELFQPGDTVTIQFKTRTTPNAATSGSWPIAWNSVAAGGAALAGTQRITVPGTEGRRVGVTYPTGPITVQKVVSGPGAAAAPTQFHVALQCASSGVTLVDLPNLTLIPGGPAARVSLLPYGTQCTVTETPPRADESSDRQCGRGRPARSNWFGAR